MQFIYISATIVILLIIGLFFAIKANKINQAAFKKTGKYPVGHYQSQGIAIGLAIGLPIGVAMGNTAIGPAIGIAIGVAIGQKMEEDHKSELRPLTEEEKEMQDKMKKYLLALTIAGIVIFALIATQLS